MKRLLVSGLLLSGCVSAQRKVSPVSTYGVRASVQSAEDSARNAAGSALRAKLSLKSAADKTAELLVVATPMQKPLVLQIRTNLEQTRSSLDATLEQLDATHGALADSAGRIGTLQTAIDGMGTELARAQDAERKEKIAREFWRGVAMKLAALSGVLGLWIFRRPLAALCGMALPIP